MVVHELGHFSAAKFFGIRVDEFGLGYPPRVLKLFTWKNTLFSLNGLPFGGFVKIYGESYEEAPAKTSDSFQYKNRGIQAIVLVSGVLGNFLLAWFLFSLGFVTGIPAPAGTDLPIADPQTVITQVVPDSPAFVAGVKSGDTVLSLSRGGEVLTSPFGPEEAASFITSSAKEITLNIQRGDESLTKTLLPQSGLWSAAPAVGIAMETVGTVRLSFFSAIKEGLTTTLALTWETAKALVSFFSQAILGRADLSTVTGPVGLVGLVGDVSRLGFGHLITFTALISINLCLINLMPFPALDGGRLLFVAIESMIRRQIPARFFNLINFVGFGLLLLLMLIITVNDIGNLL